MSKKNAGIVFLVVGVLLIFCSLYGIAVSLSKPMHMFNADPEELEAERRKSMLFIIGCLVSFILGVIISAIGLGKIRKARNEI